MSHPEKRSRDADGVRDRAAFGELVRAHDRRLRALAARMVDQAKVDDVLQESYLKAFRGVGSFRAPDGALGAWLAQIVYRTCIDEIRNVKRNRLEPISEVGEVPDTDSGPERVVVERQLVTAALARLTPEHRAAVVLVDALGFDYREAANIIGVRRGTLASRLSHSREELRKILAAGLQRQDSHIESGGEQ